MVGVLEEGYRDSMLVREGLVLLGVAVMIYMVEKGEQDVARCPRVNRR